MGQEVEEDRPGEGDLAQRIERVTELPMLILAFAYLIVFVLEYLPGVSTEVVDNATLVEYFIVATFAAELLVKLAVASDRVRFLRTHWIDVLIVVVPFLRPLRVLRVARLVPFLVRAVRGLGRILGPYRGAYVLVVGVLAVFMSSVLMVLFERGAAGGQINDLGDALWWAVETVATVGYGDVVPVTAEGKAVAVFLMLVGIALFGMLTASVAAYFVEDTAQREQREEIRRLSERLGRIEARLEEQNEFLKTRSLTRQEEEKHK